VLNQAEYAITTADDFLSGSGWEVFDIVEAPETWRSSPPTRHYLSECLKDAKVIWSLPGAAIARELALLVFHGHRRSRPAFTLRGRLRQAGRRIVSTIIILLASPFFVLGRTSSSASGQSQRGQARYE
jgi:hypothetical protein